MGDGLPQTMRAAVMYDVDDIRIEERPLPELGPGDALIATGASGVCSGDLMPWYVRKKAPFVFGHEPAGTVVRLGGDAGVLPNGTTLLGKRVFAHHHAPCFACEACEAGRYVHCATWRSTALDPGGMAEYFRVPRANLADTLVLPANVSFADGSLVEPLACVVKSLRRAFALELSRGVSPQPSRALTGRSLYVIGAGIMGLMHVAVATALGATVYASDFNAARRSAAERLGAVAAYAPEEAQERLRAATAGRFCDAVICGPGTSSALAAAVEATGSDGTVLMFTPLEPHERFSFDQSRAYFRDIKLVASYSCGPEDTRDALGLVASGVVSAARHGIDEFAFPAVERAYGSMKRAESIKAVVTFEKVTSVKSG